MIWHYLAILERWSDRLSTTQWFYLFAAMVFIGLFCMRGFGSRKHY